MFTIGDVNAAELNMKQYDREPSAKTVILNEQSVKRISVTSTLTTEIIYRKIKFFSKEDTDEATVSFIVPNYLDIDVTLNAIKGITYNLVGDSIVSKKLKKEDIFTEKIDDFSTQISFTMPDVKEGCIIEYEYQDYAFGIGSFNYWTFQSDIPKKISRVIFFIPAKFTYKTYLIGNLKLSNSSVFESEKCDINKKTKRKCTIALYQIENIPSLAFESYTSSPTNYLSRISLRFIKTNFYNGVRYKYYNTWKSFDNAIKRSASIGAKIKMKSYFNRKLPDTVKAIKDTLVKAKKIYYYIQSHYTTNTASQTNNVKSDFKNKYGSSLNINLALLNSLTSQGISSQLVLLSTRGHGIINKTYPEDDVYNYVIVKTTIEGKEYFLDASDKYTSFGMPPFKALNGDARVLNSKGESFWETIKPAIKSYQSAIVNLKLTDDNSIIGNITTLLKGYTAQFKRKELEEKGEEAYLSENEFINQDFEILSHTVTNSKTLEKPLREVFEITSKNDELNNDIIFINPFVYSKYTTNPFQSNERINPIDFGFTYANNQIITIEIPKNYRIKSLPKSIAVKLANNGGYYSFNIGHNESKITINSRFSINKSYFSIDEYSGLKEFYNQIIKTQNSLITLEKI